MRSYVLKIEVRPEGYITARYFDNAKNEIAIALPIGKDKLNLTGDYETINIMVNILRDNRLKGDN